VAAKKKAPVQNNVPRLCGLHAGTFEGAQLVERKEEKLPLSSRLENWKKNDWWNE